MNEGYAGLPNDRSRRLHRNHPDTIEQMARDAIAFVTAMELSQVDLLGFSIGSFVAQQIALVRPDMVRRLILASSAPQGAADMHGWAPEVMRAIGTPHTSPEGYLDVFFARSAASRQAGTETQRRAFLASRPGPGSLMAAGRPACKP